MLASSTENTLRASMARYPVTYGIDLQLHDLQTRRIHRHLHSRTPFGKGDGKISDRLPVFHYFPLPPELSRVAFRAWWTGP
jgi:hypothetical protein